MISTSTGIPENLSGIIDATIIKGADSQVIDDSTYSNGNAVRCAAPNGEIINTGWLPAGTLAGAMNLVFYSKSNVADDTNFVQIYIWRRDNIGTESLETGAGAWSNPETKAYADVLGLTIGRINQGFYNINYEYKIIIKTVPTLASGKYVDMDYIQFIPSPINPLLYYANGYRDVDVVGEYIFVPAMERISLTVTGTGTTKATKAYTTTNYYGDSTVTGSSSDSQMLVYSVTDPSGTTNAGTIGLCSTDGLTFTGTWHVEIVVNGRAIIPAY